MSVSLKSIAEALNVSKTTVSWVLGGQGNERKISLATQKKIKEYAKKHDYYPNLLAKSLISGKSNTIGLIIPSISDTFYAQIARQVELEADRLGYTVTFCSSEADCVKECKMIKMLKQKKVDGLIIAPTQKSKEEIETLMKESFPFVLIDRFFHDLETNYVIVDNERGAFIVVDKLISQGYKKIVFVTSDTHLGVMQMRYEGYKKALVKSSINFDPALILDIDRKDYENDIIKKLNHLFKNVQNPDAFFFTTHYLALEGLRYFSKKNINVETQIGLGCFHQSPSLRILAPNMIIAEQPVTLIGKKAVQTLIQSINSKSQTIVKKVLPMDLL